jgi:putative hydrolase of HD superfamily
MELRGEQIVLRDWRREDIPLYAYWLAPSHEWHRFDGPYYGPLSQKAIEEIVERKRAMIERDEQSTPREDLVIADRATNQLIGRVNRYWVSHETYWLALGICIYESDRWNRAIGYEALGLWSDHLFTELPDLARLDLRTWSGNPGMMRLARKLGYREEARFRKARIVDGEYYDGLGYGVLREEWMERYPAGFARHLAESSARDVADGTQPIGSMS